ncbi:MAG: SpoIIE family protein phosphatase [Spirochaetes bacterium]|nr:SpoIIE family protein phosphatase [Spirochaetota bacterium]
MHSFFNISKNKLLSGLKKKEIDTISGLLKHEHFPKGTYVIKKGEQKRKVYCIVKGNVEVLSRFDFYDEIRLGILTEGDFFGEMSFFTQNYTRTAHIKALTDLELLSLDSKAFDIIIKEFPLTMQNITRTAVLRLQDSNKRFVDKAAVEQEILSQRIRQRNEKLKLANSILSRQNRETRKDLLLARNIQKKFLPEKEINFPGIKISTYYRPCTELGGDICGIKRINNHQIVVYGGDVSGHGTSAALITIYLKQIIETYTLEKREDGSEQLREPGEVLTLLNTRFIDDINEGNPELYFTVFYSIIDTELSEIGYSSAGIHCPPLIISGSRAEELFKQSDFPIGHVERHVYDSYKTGLTTHNKLLFISDGVVEVYNGKEYFGMNRLKKLLHSALSEEGKISLEKIHRKVTAFTKEKKPLDDMCYLLIDLHE